MDNDHEKVCRRCGTLNDERSLMCMRCGDMLDVSEEKKYAIFKGKMISEKLFLFLFIILFVAYSFGMIFYAAPCLYEKIVLFGNEYVFNFYHNPILTKIVSEVIYTICLLLINLIFVSLIIDIVINAKLIKRNKVTSTCVVMFIAMTLSFISLTIYKYKFNYVIILEHFASLIVAYPYISRKVFKRSV